MRQTVAAFGFCLALILLAGPVQAQTRLHKGVPTSCPPGTVPVPETDNCMPEKKGSPTPSAQSNIGQTRTFACPKGQAITLTITGPNSISAGPIEGHTMSLKVNPRNQLQFTNGDYAVTIAASQTEITVAIPDFGTVKCSFQPQAAKAGQPGVGNTDPCGPGFRQVPETDRCDPIPGNTAPQAPRKPSAEAAAAGKLPMGGRSLGGIMRAGPTQSSARVLSTGDGNELTLLERGPIWDGYNWFKIQYQGRTGYQWGGIMCSHSPLAGIYEQCAP